MLRPEQQAIQIVATWRAIEEAQRTDALLRYYIVLAIKDAIRDTICTPEERAVIEAALYWRHIYADVFSLESDDRPVGLTDAETLLERAVDALLAARTKPEKADNGTV